MLLSIVVPVYNELATIEKIVHRVIKADLPMDKELIVVDDGSTDGSRDAIRRLPEKFEGNCIRVFFHEANRGKGAALRTGFSKTSGDIVIIQDADLEYSPVDYPRIIRPILDGRADAVYGSRFMGSEEKRILFFWHMVGNKFLTLISNMFTNLNLSDVETCYKAFRGDLIRSFDIKSDDFRVEVELTAKLARSKSIIYEVGIAYSGRDYSEGKKITWIDGFKAIGAIIRFNLMKWR